MKALSLSIYTGSDEAGHKVTMTAEFETHQDAVRFHEGVARLCRDVSLRREQPAWMPKLLTK